MRGARSVRIGLALLGALAGLLLAVGSGPVGGPGGPEPAGAAASSWKLVRRVDFGDGKLPQGCGAYSGTYTAGASVWTKDDVSVSKGRLRLRLAERTASGRRYTSGAVGCWGWEQKYGRYEVRAKVPAGVGIDSYLALPPGDDGTDSTDGFTSVQLLAPGPDFAEVSNGFDGGAETRRVQGRYAGRFRTYVIEWAPRHLLVSVDGAVIFASRRAYSGRRWFSMAVSTGDSLTGLPDAATRLPASFEIDRVRISRYTGVRPKFRPARVPAVPDAANRPDADPSATPRAGVSTASTPPTATASPTATALPTLAATSPDAGPTASGLVGGLWPWLLGGSILAGLAALGWARHRPSG